MMVDVLIQTDPLPERRFHKKSMDDVTEDARKKIEDIMEGVPTKA